MTVWIDQPIWPAHGRLFAHLVSDVSYDELHEVARAARPAPAVVRRRPLRRARRGGGRTPSTPAPRRRRGSTSRAGSTRPGLRLRKRKRDRGVRRILDVPFPNGVERRRPRRLRRPDATRRASWRPWSSCATGGATSSSCTACVAASGARPAGGARTTRHRSRTPSARRSRRPASGCATRTCSLAATSGSRRAPTTTSSRRDKPFLQVFRTRLDDVRPPHHRRRRRHPRDPLGHAAGVRRALRPPLLVALAVEVFPDLRGLARPL